MDAATSLRMDGGIFSSPLTRSLAVFNKLSEEVGDVLLSEVSLTAFRGFTSVANRHPVDSPAYELLQLAKAVILHHPFPANADDQSWIFLS